MKFVSPYSLPGIGTDINVAIERKELLMARKRLVAEIDLSDAQTVVINGQEYTKDDILKLFEEFESDEVLEFHRLIAKDKTFLAFLQSGTVAERVNIERLPEYGSPEFTDFVSPYFKEQFEPLLLSYYKKRDYINLIKLLKMNRFMNLQDEEACFRKCYEDLNGIIEKIEDANKGIRANRVFAVPADVAQAYSKNYLSSISLFPDFFMEIRCKLARNLIILYVECYNVLKRTDISGEIIRNLFFLNVDEETRTELRRREEEYKNASRSTAQAYSGSSSSSGSGGGKAAIYGVIFVIGILVKVLLLGKSCGRSHTDYSYLNNNYYNNPIWNQSQKSNEENNFYENQENKKFISFLDSVYDAQPKKAKKVSGSGNKFPKPERVYEDVLSHDGFFSGAMQDTAELVLMNTSAYELCVILSGKSGAAAWYIPPGDSVNVYSNESVYKVYFAEGRNFTAKKKYKVFEYDNNLGHYAAKAISLKTFKSFANDDKRQLLNPKLVDQRKVRSDAGSSSTEDLLLERLAALSSSSSGSKLFKRRNLLFFEGNEYGMNVTLQRDSRLSDDVRTVYKMK